MRKSSCEPRATLYFVQIVTISCANTKDVWRCAECAFLPRWPSLGSGPPRLNDQALLYWLSQGEVTGVTPVVASYLVPWLLAIIQSFHLYYLLFVSNWSVYWLLFGTCSFSSPCMDTSFQFSPWTYPRWVLNYNPEEVRHACTNHTMHWTCSDSCTHVRPPLTIIRLWMW